MTRYYSVDEAYASVLDDILRRGTVVSPRGMATRELMHASFTIDNASANIVTSRERRLNYVFSVAEFVWIVLGRRDVASIAYFNKNIAQFSDDGVHFFGAYGPHVAAQLPYVIETLRRDPLSRQAVLTIWRPSPPPTKDVPCTVALQFLLRDGWLHGHGFMRSNDAWLGLPYDVFTFTRIQSMVAGALGAKTGQYTHTVGSLHLYELDWSAAASVISGAWGKARSPAIAPPQRFGLNEMFTALSDPETAPTVSLADVEEPWRTYMAVLKYKTTRDRGLLAPPYDGLIAARKDG